MPATNQEALRDISATLLITVWGRALASAPPLGFIDDPFAVELLEQRAPLFEVLEKTSKSFRQLMAVGVGVRTRCFDEQVKSFLAKHPKGLVLNIGCGLDARAHRLDNGEATWVDVDVPESIALRRELLPTSERHIVVEGSLTAPDTWVDQVPRESRQPMLLTVEGTLMYFDENDVRSFIESMVDAFGEFDGYVELVGDFAKDKVHPAVKAVGSDAPFRCGFRRPAVAFAAMHSALRILGHESLFEHERSRWGVFRWLTAVFPSLHDRLGSVLISFTTSAKGH